MRDFSITIFLLPIFVNSISGPVPFEQHFTLTPIEEGTKLEAVLEAEPGGVFKLAQPLMAPAMHKQLKDVVSNLKRLLEQ